MTTYDETVQKLAARVGNAEHRASVAEAEAAELREMSDEAARKATELRRRAERAEAERDDLRDELDGIELPPSLASGARRARKYLAKNGAGR